MDFGRKISALRKDKKWSQEKLAEKIGTSSAMVSKYERGDINPSIEVAKKVSRSFEVSLDYLIDEEEGMSPFQDKKMVERLTRIQNLPDIEKEHILATVDAFIRDYSTRKEYSK